MMWGVERVLSYSLHICCGCGILVGEQGSGILVGEQGYAVLRMQFSPYYRWHMLQHGLTLHQHGHSVLLAAASSGS